MGCLWNATFSLVLNHAQPLFQVKSMRSTRVAADSSTGDKKSSRADTPKRDGKTETGAIAIYLELRLTIVT